MIVQVQDILKDAMGLVGGIEIDETPSASDMALALRTCNIMLARWSSQRLVLRSAIATTFSVSATKASYTVGLSNGTLTPPDVVIAKPLKATAAYVIDGGVSYPVEIVSQDIFDTIQDRQISNGRPQYAAYDPGAGQQQYQQGTLNVCPVPDRTYPLTVSFDSYLTEFTNMTDTVTFEPMYYEAIIYGLGVRLFRHFNDAKAQVPSDTVAIANNAFAAIRDLNSVTPIAGMDFPGAGSSYNILTDR